MLGWLLLLAVPHPKEGLWNPTPGERSSESIYLNGTPALINGTSWGPAWQASQGQSQAQHCSRLQSRAPLQPQLVSHPRVAHPAPRQELQQQGSGTLLLAPLLEGPEANSSQASVLWGREVPGWTLLAPHTLAAGGSRLGSEHKS